MKAKPTHIRAVIVDDELQGIKSLDRILKQHCSEEIEVVKTFSSSLDALKEIPKLDVDLLLLDIRMPQLNGLELHELLGFDSYCVIYTTASDDSSDIIKALRFNAIDYLLKPISADALKAAVKKAGEEQPISEGKKAMEDWQNGIDQDSRFGIKEGNKLVFEALRNIVYCQSDGNFTKIFLKDERCIYSSFPMVELEEKLKGPFIRIHREYMINKEYIKELEGNSILLSNKKYLPISRKRKKEVGEILEK